jgi:spore germination cell wall hydrolase CwlJ-like protein
LTNRTPKVTEAVETLAGALMVAAAGTFFFFVGSSEEVVPPPVVEEVVVPVEEPDLPYDNPQLQCLALNIYHEARSDNYAGRMAVADVTLNRVEHTRFPDTVCGVVQQAKLSDWHLERGREVPLKHKCQFSWFCDGLDDEPLDEDCWQEAQLLAYNVLANNEMRGITEGATHYHATYVLPKWSKDRNMRLIGRIGAHIFYRQD